MALLQSRLSGEERNSLFPPLNVGESQSLVPPGLFLVHAHPLGHHPSIQGLNAIDMPVSTQCSSPASTFPCVLDSYTNRLPVSMLDVSFTAQNYHIQIELLASTAQLPYPSTKPILPISHLSQENSIIYPGVPDSFFLLPSESIHNSCRSLLYSISWSDPLSCLYHSHASLGSRPLSSDPCSSPLSVSMLLLEIVLRCNSDHISPYSFPRLPLSLRINFESINLAYKDRLIWPLSVFLFCLPPCPLLFSPTGLFLVLHAPSPFLPQGCASCPKCSSPSCAQDWLFVFNYISS